jgi:hypothetical protein
MYSRSDEAAVWRRVLSPIVWAGLGLVCVMLTSPARATAAPDDRRFPSAPANADSAAAGAARVRDRRIESERTGDLRPPQKAAERGAASEERNSAAVAPRRGLATPQRGRVTPQHGLATPQHEVHQSAGGDADRVGALGNTQPQGRPALQTSRSFGANRAATGAPGLDGPGGSRRNALPTKATAMTRNSQIGGAREQRIGRLDGAAVGRTNHSTVIDGTQFRRRF